MLLDHKAKQIEFVKQPQSIEKAVKEVVAFLESSRKGKVDVDRKTAFIVRSYESDDDDVTMALGEFGLVFLVEGRDRLAHFPVRQNPGQVVSNQQHNSGACYTYAAVGHFLRNCPTVSQQMGKHVTQGFYQWVPEQSTSLEFYNRCTEYPSSTCKLTKCEGCQHNFTGNSNTATYFNFFWYT